MQPLLAQLECIVMLQNLQQGSFSTHANMDQAELQRISAETVLLAAEQRLIADQQMQPQQHQALAASDIHNLTGQMRNTLALSMMPETKR